MTVSENGWPAGSGNIASFTVPGTSVQVPLNKTCAPLLLHVAALFNTHVERLRPGWCWGYAYRDIRGSDTVSNHASGTAIDLNAPLHPLGTSPYHSFSNGQVVAIHSIIESMNGTIRWGGDYSGRQDPMHFEIHVGYAAVEAEIARLHPAHPYPGVLKFGMSGAAVTMLQKRLVALGVQMAVDGVYGKVTVAAVTHFQMTHHLGQDGIVGPATWMALWS